LPAPPIVRGQKPDDAPARPMLKLEMPPPEALGVPAPAAPPDWTELRVRLDRIGATGFAMRKQADGSYRFACQVRPAGGPPRTVEGRGATEAEAVRRAVAAAGK
jgi:hypothetical protein